MIRPLLEDDLPAAALLLAEGFPERGIAFWELGLQRMRRYAQNVQVGVPLGLLLMDGGQPVGVALTPASLRHRADGSTYALINLSSWYVRPAFRWRAGLMFRALVSDPKATYVDLTPNDEVKRILPMFGFRPVNLGTTMAPLPLHALGPGRGAQVRELRPGDVLPLHAPPLEMVLAHRELNCVPLLMDHPEGQTLFVYRRKRAYRVPCARLKYIGSHAVLRRHLPVLARHLLARGFGLLAWDTRPGNPVVPRTVQRAGGIWYAKGETFADCTDFIGTELCILGV